MPPTHRPRAHRSLGRWRAAWLWTLAACLGCAAPPARPTPDTAAPRADATRHADRFSQPLRWIVHARLVDPDGRTVRPGHLRLQGGRIAEVRRGPAPATGPGVLDVGGRWVMPGLVDLHVHGWGNPSPTAGPDHACGHAETARLQLAAGVVAYLDLGSRAARVFRVRDQLRRGAIPGARLFAAGPVLGHIKGMKPPPRGADRRLRLVRSAAEARAQVRALAAQRPDVVKVLVDHTGDQQALTEATLRAVVREAGKHGLRVVCHIGTWRDGRACLDAGGAALTHLWDEAPVPPALVRDLAARQVPVIPTQPVQVDLPRYAGAQAVGLGDPLLRPLTTARLRAAYADPSRFVKKARFWLRYQSAHKGDYERQLLALHRGGVTLLTGSDSGNFGTFHGHALHRELALLGEAGVPSWAALQAATTAAGRFLGLRLGVRVGDAASFVVLDASPVDNLAATQQLRHVVQSGRLVDRRMLLRGTSVATQPSALPATPRLWPPERRGARPSRASGAPGPGG